MNERDLSASQLRYLIDEWVSNEKYRKILVDRMIHGRTFEKIAEDYEMSVRQIKNIVCRYGDKVLLHADSIFPETATEFSIYVTLHPLTQVTM